MTTEAAYKAWETRRRNGWIHPNKREDDPPPPKKSAKTPKGETMTRGQKAAATRRANQRSARSKKAWATRRANAV